MIKNHIIYNNYSDWRFDVSKANGSYIYDSSGKKFIDFTSGWNVTNLGWNNPEVNQAVINQIKKSTFVPMWTADPVQNLLASELVKVMPKGLNTVARATGGTEANEEAMKTARAYTGRKKILGFKNTYHGQSFGTMALGYLPEYVESISPLVGDFIQIDFPKTYADNHQETVILKNFSDVLEKQLINKDVAAIVTEAGMITGWGSAYVSPRGYLKVVRDLTQKYGTLLVLDEVGTGFSRLGKLFGMQIENIMPDIVTLAKGLSNGAGAIGAMITTNEIAEKSYKTSNLTSTFGWIPVSCAASVKTLQIHQRDRIWEKSQKDGEYFMNTLKSEFKNNSYIEDIRGIGMEIGLHVKSGYADKVVDRAMEKGLHLVSDHMLVIQIMPPLTIERSDLDKGIETLISVINSLS